MAILIIAETVEQTSDTALARTWYSDGASHLIKTVANGPIYGRRVSFRRPADEAAARSIMGIAA